MEEEWRAELGMKRRQNDCGGRGLTRELAGARHSPLRLAEPDRAARDGETILRFRLRTFGATVDVGLAAAPAQARLADLVAPVHELADLAVRLLRRKTASRGTAVPCRRGCSACCRYFVPISPPEAMALADHVACLPPPRREAIELRFASAARAVLSAAPSLQRRPTAEGISRWYWGLKLDCPLLAQRACSAYPLRPVACREHLVTCPPRDCADEQSLQSPLPVPLSLGHVLCQAAADIEGTHSQSLLLPLTLSWAADQSARCERTYPAAELAEALGKALQTRQPLAA
jgi:hypothetical protein